MERQGFRDLAAGRCASADGRLKAGLQRAGQVIVIKFVGKVVRRLSGVNRINTFESAAENDNTFHICFGGICYRKKLVQDASQGRSDKSGVVYDTIAKEVFEKT